MDSSLVAVLANAGVAGIVVILIILGYLVPKPAYARLLEENEKLKEALDLERERSDDATQAGAVTNQLIAGLVKLATEHRDADTSGHRAGLEITGKDLGL